MPQSDIGTVKSRVSPVITAGLYSVGRRFVLPNFFGRMVITGAEQVPTHGPLVIAPTHRSRWDGPMVGYAFGRPVTGRDPRYMVSANEMMGAQGWLIRQFGGFPVDTDRAAVAALRHGIELLRAGEALVIFPEGDIMRDRTVKHLKPGLGRLAIQAQTSLAASTMPIQILPVALNYEQLYPTQGCNVEVKIGAPLSVQDYLTTARRTAAKNLMVDLQTALNQLSGNLEFSQHTMPAPVHST